MDPLAPSQSPGGDGRRCRLLTMPLEILQQISSHLTTPEYGYLRRTCKHIEASLFQSFAREFFVKRQFMLTEFSLQALVDISKSRFAPWLTHVIFSVERPSPRTVPNNYLAANGPLLPAQISHKMARFRQEYLDHTSLLDTGHWIDMTVDAFNHLPNLETVGMRDFNSRTRYRDGGRTECTRLLYEQSNFTTRHFTGLLRALGKTSARPTRIEVILRHSGLHDHAFNIPRYVENVVLPVLSRLRTLYLDLNSDFIPALIADGQSQTVPPGYLLRRFLGHVSQLEHLRLNFTSYRPGDAQDVLSWLAASPSADASNTAPGAVSTSPQPVHFANLQQLDLGMVTVEPRTLLAVVHKHRDTLRGISLHKLSLLDTSDSTGRVDLWRKLFTQLSRQNLSLNQVMVRSASQEKPSQLHRREITFKDSSQPVSRTWKGKDLEGALNDFAENVVVDWPEDDTGSSDDDEVDEEDDDSE
jgi:hypothetical protein